MNLAKKKRPEITVLMAVYNGERWLVEAIESVLTQTFEDFEFIIINDGSNDRSLEIMNDFSKKDDRIKIYSKSNSGLADSLNFGLRKSKGKWVARLDADDVCVPDRLAKQIEQIKLRKNLVLVGSNLFIIDQDCNKTGHYSYPFEHRKLKRRIARGDSFFPHSSAFFKLSIVQKIGGYRNQFKRSQDQDLWLRLSEVGELACVQQPLVLIRKHANQISLDKDNKPQTIYSHMAMTCYYLRKINGDDPIKLKDQLVNAEFYNFIQKKLILADYFEYQSFIRSLKRNITKQSSSILKISEIIKAFVFNPHMAYRLTKDRVWGSNLPQTFAKDWVSWRTKA